MLRQRNRTRSGFVPVAAEVLEHRALLSAGAAAAHSASQHATAVHSASHAPDIQPDKGFSGSVIALIGINGVPVGAVPGQFSISNFKQQTGAKMTAHFSFSASGPSSSVSLKGSFSGTVALITPGGGSTLFVLTPTGGSIKLTEKTPAGTIKATAVPDGSPILVTLSNSTGALTAFGETDIFQAGSPAGLGGKLITIII